METQTNANRKYKDSVFTLLFRDKNILVRLYNAIFGTNYPADTEVVITTLVNALSMGRINDLSFVLDNRLIILIEHQSTISDNIPYRMFQYVAEIYKRLHE